jgi:hypothetical protein
VSKKKNQHIVPQFYLRRFCRDGKLWLFDKKNGKYWHQNPSEVVKKAHFYSVVGEDGSLDTGVEDILGIIERTTHDIFAKIDAGQSLDEIDKATLARFIAYQMVRVPYFRNMCNSIGKSVYENELELSFGNKKRASQSLIDMGKNESTITEEHLEKLVNFVNRRAYTINISKNLSLEMMLQFGDVIGRLFYCMKWSIHSAARGGAFITSDNPLTIVGPPMEEGARGVRVLTPGALKLFPLGSNHCLVMEDRGDTIVRKPLQRKLVRWMNSCTAGNCTRFLMARDKEVLAKAIEVAAL